MRNYLFTSESVSEGHPDKIADQISDVVLDAYLEADPKCRVACETMISTGFVMLAGEVSSKVQVDIPELVRKTIRRIGYTNSDIGFDAGTCAVQVAMGRQSPDIAQGVDVSENHREQGAGDQGIMFGYAIDETPECMPLTISLAHKLVRELSHLRKQEKVSFIRPDSKSQVTVEYVDGKPRRIDTVVLSTQHHPDASQSLIQSFVHDELLPRVIPREMLDEKTKFFVNPTGRFVIGGPQGDCGLTGRKIIVDTYGGHGAHGGGAFSGKDPSKVDRSAAYAARHIAKNIVAAGLARKVLVQLAYAIGMAEPVSVMINEFGTGKVSSEVLSKAVRRVWSLKPADIVAQFDLLKPRYFSTAAYGHFGRSESEFTWEKTDKIEAIKEAAQTMNGR